MLLSAVIFVTRCWLNCCFGSWVSSRAHPIRYMLLKISSFWQLARLGSTCMHNFQSGRSSYPSLQCWQLTRMRSRPHNLPGRYISQYSYIYSYVMSFCGIRIHKFIGVRRFIYFCKSCSVLILHLSHSSEDPSPADHFPLTFQVDVFHRRFVRGPFFRDSFPVFA